MNELSEPAVPALSEFAECDSVLCSAGVAFVT